MFLHSPNCSSSHFLQDSFSVSALPCFLWLVTCPVAREVEVTCYSYCSPCVSGIAPPWISVTPFRTWHKMWAMSSYLLYIPCHLDSWLFFFFNTLILSGGRACCKGSHNKVFPIIEKKKPVVIFLMVKSFKDPRSWNGSFINMDFNN